MKKVDFLAASGMAIALAVASSHAATIIVPTQHPNIQAAVNAASAGDTVLVLDGVYAGAGNSQIDLLGKSITLRSASGPESCVIDVAGTPFDQRTAFYLHSGETSATVIEGFTVKHGYQFNGPGMLLIHSSPTVRNCVFTENHADCWGGVVYFDGGSSPHFTDCRFVANYSADDGGAVFGFQGSPTFTNCLFADNIAPSAGAILTFGSGDAPKLINCTVAGNTSNFAPAIYSNNLIIENTIIWGNTGGSEAIYAPAGSTLAVRYSNVQGGFAGEGNLNVAPQFADASAGDYHLLPGSLCVDAGDPASVVPEGTTDGDGDPRSFGASIDLGIDEFRKAGDVNGDHLTNVNDLLAVITAWGPCSWSTADLNHDFAVSASDLITVIVNWD